MGPLAQVFIYKSLVELDKNQKRRAILDAINAAPLPNPVENAPSPISFEWNDAARLAVVSGKQSQTAFPYVSSEADHARTLDATRKQFDRLLAALDDQRLNVRGQYREAVKNYLGDLPTGPGVGNMILADAEYRILCDLFIADTHSLPPGFAARLKAALQQHKGLRPFYPEIERFYQAVRHSTLEEPLPQEAVQRLVRIVNENTPQIFESNVSAGIAKVDRERPKIESCADEPLLSPEDIRPEPDPLGQLQPLQSYSYSVASTANAMYGAFLSGRNSKKPIPGWSAVATQIGESMQPIIDWLRHNRPSDRS